MSEQSFSFTFNLSATPRVDDESSERVVARPFDAFSVTPTEAQVRVVHGETMHRLAHADVMILQQCDRPRSLSGHADELCRRDGAAFRTRALDSLQNLRKRGLLASERELLDEFGRTRTRSPRPDMEALYIRSSGRPQALARGLGSIVDGRCAEAGITRCVVIDDTPDSAKRREIDGLISDAGKHSDIRLVHLDARHRRRLVDVLSERAGIGKQHLHWFVHGRSGLGQRYGCGINTALLLSAGRRFALLDDDASLQTVIGPQDPDPAHVSICNSNDYGAAFPEPGPVAPPFREHPGFDPVSVHESWLGRTMGEIASGLGPRPARIGDPTPPILADMRAEGRIRFTVNGVFGDPGTQSPRWLFCQPIRRLTEWMQGEAGYRAALERRWIARCEPDLRVVSDYCIMTTTLTGIDDSTLMLPTLPNGAGEDALLGELVRFMDPGSLQLGMPWMLKHQPEQPRYWSAEDVARPPPLNPGLFFRHMLDNLSRTTRSDDHDSRAAILKQTLADLAHAEDREVRSELVKQVMSARSQISMLIAQQCAEASVPDYLQRDYDRLQQAIAESRDLDTAQLTTAVGVIRDTARRYAAGMDDWISVWDIARQIGGADLVDQITRP